MEGRKSHDTVPLRSFEHGFEFTLIYTTKIVGKVIISNVDDTREDASAVEAN
jgi:hypothetical protein